jgi:transcriptional regulatory protein LevR
MATKEREKRSLRFIAGLARDVNNHLDDDVECLRAIEKIILYVADREISDREVDFAFATILQACIQNVESSVNLAKSLSEDIEKHCEQQYQPSASIERQAS